MNEETHEKDVFRRSETGELSFSCDDAPILRRVFRKLCGLKDALEEIETWIDSRRTQASELYLPASARQGEMVLTPASLESFVAAERRANLESQACRQRGESGLAY